MRDSVIWSIFDILLSSIDFTAAAQFVREIDRAVVYKANGSQKHQSGGLSFYYPFRPDDKKLDFYCRQICPSKNYITYLKTVYGHIPRDPIIFTDSGSMAADGSFQIQLADTSRNYILSVEYRLLEMSLGGEAGKPVLTAPGLGTTAIFTGIGNRFVSTVISEGHGNR
ncbi:MAG: hypothetical protein ACLSB9_18505 [Hydrogeniiclostridium mannosilyticum]